MDEILVLEDLASLGTNVSIHVAVEGSTPGESIHDLIHLVGRQRSLTGFGCRLQECVAQLGQVYLAAVVIIER